MKKQNDNSEKYSTNSKICVGNWKLNSDLEFIQNFVLPDFKSVETVIAPPLPFIHQAQCSFTSHIKIAAQNCSEFISGNHTGQVSPIHLKDIGVTYVILGHSEMRQLGENNQTISKKIEAALKSGLKIILCIGETLEERKNAKEVVTTQIKECLKSFDNNNHIILAYEPVWAIGTGKTATKTEIEDIVSAIIQFKKENKIEGRVLYGGSVTAENAKEIAGIKNIDGFLVGGASLKNNFIDIIKALE
ncbi:Triose phosphate isomerase [Spraguea lophii 42_110]|uniref:Triosephosphate isomerase n=1 Tax=Spraguea lophii (strain 42_110) TaxID=1358809 RepID=S7W5R7_SPRLO|nr:Triose phosphate isomerase [Spraguea lophii 42_110]